MARMYEYSQASVVGILTRVLEVGAANFGLLAHMRRLLRELVCVCICGGLTPLNRAALRPYQSPRQFIVRSFLFEVQSLSC